MTSAPILKNRAVQAAIGVVLFGSGCLVFAATPAPEPGPSPRLLVQTAADAVLRDYPDPPPFNWGEGVLMAGMMRAHQLTKDDRYLRFVQRFADHWQTQGIGQLLKKEGYCGHWGPAFPLLLLHEETRSTNSLQLADQIVQFILHQGQRTRDGGLSHFFGKSQLWVDTLAMCCPVLSHAARIKRQPALQDEAVRQLEIFAAHLQDPDTGLFYHMWDETNATRTTAFWARGNGWVALSFAEVLKHAHAGSPAYSALLPRFKKQIDGIVLRQDTETGLWHTVLESPETYLETSASAMFLYAMAESTKARILGQTHRISMRKAWTGLSARLDAQGRVIGVSGGTRPGTKAAYAKIPSGIYSWGTGAFLLAGCAYAEVDAEPSP